LFFSHDPYLAPAPLVGKGHRARRLHVILSAAKDLGPIPPQSVLFAARSYGFRP
jgi:hypothetical protein